MYVFNIWRHTYAKVPAVAVAFNTYVCVYVLAGLYTFVCVITEHIRLVLTIRNTSLLLLFILLLMLYRYTSGIAWIFGKLYISQRILYSFIYGLYKLHYAVDM